MSSRKQKADEVEYERPKTGPGSDRPQSVREMIARGNAQPYGEVILNFADGSEALIFRAGLLFTVGG